jgi:hypothetical protein
MMMFYLASRASWLQYIQIKTNVQPKKGDMQLCSYVAQCVQIPPPILNPDSSAYP